MRIHMPVLMDENKAKYTIDKEKGPALAEWSFRAQPTQ